MRIGLFGGSFDPIHLGHLILAEQCREQGRLDQVWFIPAARPPHKKEHELARFENRVEMLHLALAGNPAFRVEEIENERDGPSFTVDTVAELKRRHPGDEFFFLVGSDSLADLPKWHEPQRLVRSAGLLVMARPTSPLLTPDQLRALLRLPPEVPLHLDAVDSPLVIDISSRDVRYRLASGRTVRYLLPRAVECYIADKRLYRVEEKT